MCLTLQHCQLSTKTYKNPPFWPITAKFICFLAPETVLDSCGWDWGSQKLEVDIVSVAMQALYVAYCKDSLIFAYNYCKLWWWRFSFLVAKEAQFPLGSPLYPLLSRCKVQGGEPLEVLTQVHGHPWPFLMWMGGQMSLNTCWWHDSSLTWQPNHFELPLGHALMGCLCLWDMPPPPPHTHHLKQYAHLQAKHHRKPTDPERIL